MCLNPIHIKSGKVICNRIDSDGVVTSSVQYGYDVPCGKCKVCLNNKINDYIIRSFAEYNDCGHKAVFCTLTYSNRYLPRYNNIYPPVFDDSQNLVEDGSLIPYSCFDKSHLQSFLKKLNEKALYLIGTKYLGLQRLVTLNGRRVISPEWKEFLSIVERPFRYLVTSERGKADIYINDKGFKRRGTNRPHYHCIINIHNKFLSILDVLNLVRDTWIYGRSYNLQICNNKFNGDVDRDYFQCIKYVCKYIIKDISEYDGKILYYGDDDKNRFSPFVLISNNYGSGLLSKYTDDELVNKIVNGISVNDGKRVINFRVPRYNILKSPLYVHHICGSYLHTKYINDYTFDDCNLVSLDNDFQHTLSVKKECYLTPLGQRINEIKSEKFVRDNLALLDSVIKDSSLFLHCASLSDTKVKTDDLDYIHLIDRLSYEIFLINLYRLKDDYTDYDLNFKVYDILRKYKATYTMNKIKLLENTYKSNLSKAIIERPELFNVKPI